MQFNELFLLIGPFIQVQLDKNGRAVGVWYIRQGTKYYVRSRKEIIVSAGSIDSPKLLMLSGIGPKRHLEEIKVLITITTGIYFEYIIELSIF